MSISSIVRSGASTLATKLQPTKQTKASVFVAGHMLAVGSLMGLGVLHAYTPGGITEKVYGTNLTDTHKITDLTKK